MVTSAQYIENGSILATIDGTEWTIPNDVGNRFRQMVADWETAGNTITPYAPPSPSITDYQDAIQSHIDATAVSKQFNDGVTLASYKSSTNPTWAAQATVFIAWRDQVWEQAYVKMAAVQAGQIPQPTVADVVASLPAIVWP